MNLRTKVYLTAIAEFIIMVLALFLSAGTINWLAGWIYLALFWIFSTATVLWLLRCSPGLLEERMGMFRPNQKAWDKVFLVAICVLYVVWTILMPLDAVRFNWSHMPGWIQALGAILLTCSFYIFYLTFRENPFLSATVRIQSDRGQTVITTGPYRYVRHPMYVGGVMFFIGTSLLLGSWYGFIMGLIFTLMFVGRSVFEERMLREELDGYDAYMARVKYRFIPHVW